MAGTLLDVLRRMAACIVLSDTLNTLMQSAHLQHALASQGLGEDDASEANHGCPAIPVLSLGCPDAVGKGLLACVSPVHVNYF